LSAPSSLVYISGAASSANSIRWTARACEAFMPLGSPSM
jgi:hypothetical protein